MKSTLQIRLVNKRNVIIAFNYIFLLLLSNQILGQNQIIKIKDKNITLQKIFEQIEFQTRFSIDYDTKLIDGSKIFVNPPTNIPLNEVMTILLKESNCSLIYQDSHIIISNKQNSASENSTTNSSNKKDISINGKIIDERGVPLMGVNIVLKGTTKGTTTDVNGNFSLGSQPNNNLVLIISYIGYKSQEIITNETDYIEIQLLPLFNELKNLVVIGYGTQTKRSVTGAVQSINNIGLEDIPAALLTQKLQGKLAGVQINQTTGIPGQGMSVRIRGQASISAGNDPLYVIDGFPLTSDISNLNPDEFESISVLKDASSAALYGSRAANGVILITTKKAKASTSKIDFNIYKGIQQMPNERLPEMMNAKEFAQFKKEVYQDNGQAVPSMFQNPDQYGEGTNWYKVITRLSSIQNYSLSFSSSKEKFSFNVIAGYFNQEGILLNSEFKRYSIRINTDYIISSKLRIGINIAPTNTTNKIPQSDGLWYNTPSIIQSALLTSPLAPYKNADGSIPINASNWGSPDYGTSPSPNWYNQVQVVKNNTKNMGVLANGYLEIEPLNGLTLKSSINVDLANRVNDFFNPSTAGGILNPGNENDPSRIYASHSNSHSYSWLWENIAKYIKTIEDHNFELLLGYTAQKTHSESGSFTGTGFSDNRIQTLNAAKSITGGTDIQDWSLLSVLGRVNYEYKDRYLLSAAIRRDGSSKFGSENRWGSFPSLSLGWIASDENFMKAIKPISFLKARASYGVTGNNNIGNYTQYSYLLNTNNPVDNNYSSGKSLVGLSNNYLGWENTKEIDLGLDISFAKNRINISYDYFHRNTDNLLYSVDIPISSGFFNFTTNIGKIAFWGHELMLNTKNLVGDFKWSTDFNISFNRNKALALGTSNAAIYGDNTITQVGQPIGQLYGLKWEGLYMNLADYDNSPKYTGAQVGTVKFKDVNGDGIVTNDERDKTVLGNSAPKGIYGITNTFIYKNCDISIVLSGAFGNKIFNVMERFTTNLDGAFNVYKALSRRWRSEQDPGDGIYGKDIAGTTGYERDWMSSKFLYDASYLTIKNITLGYTLPLRSKSIKSLRVYASVQQVFTFTKYPGMNPEVSSAGGLFAGNDYTTYPVPRTFTFGLNISL